MKKNTIILMSEFLLLPSTLTQLTKVEESTMAEKIGNILL